MTPWSPSRAGNRAGGVLTGCWKRRADPAEGFTTARHRTFDARALAVIRPTGTGTITVTVTAEDCTPVTLALNAR